MAEEHDKKHDEHEGGHGGGSHGGGHGGHGGGGHAEGEHEGAPEWLISFADNVMLQMGFFVILLALNMGPKGGGAEGKSGDSAGGGANNSMIDFAIAVREAFNNPVDENDPSENPEFVKRLKQLRGEGDFDGPRGDSPNQQSVRPSDFVNIGAKVNFEDNSVALTSTAKETIGAAAEKLRGARFYIEVRGHCSPSEAMRDPLRAMKISHERAVVVAKELVEAGLKWEQMRVMAYGDNDRLVARTYSRETDRNNQRVEVVVTTETLPGDPYSADGPH